MSQHLPKVLEKLLVRIIDSFKRIHQHDFDELANRIAAIACLSGAKAPYAAGELASTVSLLREERQRQGLSLRELQEASGISRSVLSEIETQKNANPSFATLNRIAEALGMKLLVALVDADDYEDEDVADAAESDLEEAS